MTNNYFNVFEEEEESHHKTTENPIRKIKKKIRYEIKRNSSDPTTERSNNIKRLKERLNIMRGIEGVYKTPPKNPIFKPKKSSHINNPKQMRKMRRKKLERRELRQKEEVDMKKIREEEEKKQKAEVEKAEKAAEEEKKRKAMAEKEYKLSRVFTQQLKYIPHNKREYHKLCLKYHPDKNNGKGHEIMGLINNWWSGV
jgi:hypothetical protein